MRYDVRDDKLYLIHILERIARIQEYVVDGQSSFMESTLVQDAVMRNLQTMGESVRRLSEETKSGRSEADWRSITGFRNVIVHNYLGMTLDRVWEVVERHLPTPKCHVEPILGKLEAHQ